MKLLRIPQTVQNIGRFRQIVTVLSRYGFAEVLLQTGIADRWMLRRLKPPAEIAELPAAERFVAVLENLGPTFVKLGQILSTRPDILSQEWTDKLARLQDTVRPLPYARLAPLIEAAAGGPVDEIFAAFDETPLAAASVSQVHAATMRDGTKAVVKVVRPGIRETVRSDVELMRIFAALLEEYVTELRSFRPTGVVAEFERAITREMDLRHEARNIERFAGNFADDERVVVPGLWQAYSNRDVLVMERINGTRITDYATYDNDPEVLAKLGVEVILKMAFYDGFFHADPHPGNIWTLPGNRIALLDMGMADSVLPDTRDVLIDMLFAVVNDAPERIAKAVWQLGNQPEDVDPQAFKRDLLRIYEDHVRGLNLNDIQVGELFAASVDAARTHHIQIPTDITLIMKALSTVEGVGKQLYPELDLVAEARPHVLKLVNMRWGPERVAKELIGAATSFYGLAIGLPERADELLARVERGRFKTRMEIEQLGPRLRGVEDAGNRVTLAILVLAMAVTATFLYEQPLLKVGGVPLLASLLFLLGLGIGGILVWSIWRSGRR